MRVVWGPTLVIQDTSNSKERERARDRWFAKQRRKGRREDHELSPDSGWTWGHEPGNNWEDWGP